MAEGTKDSIQTEIDEFNAGIAAQVPPELLGVFDQERADLVAGGVPSDAVAVGDTLPDVSMVTQTGDPVPLHSVLGDAPAVLVFYRGAWCPYCSITLKTYRRDLLPGLRSRGVALVAISPQKPEQSEQTALNWGLDFDVLSDPSNELGRALGITVVQTDEVTDASAAIGLDVASFNADSTTEIPFPTVLVIDAERVVRFADVHVDYTTHTEISAILDAVDALAAPVA